MNCASLVENAPPDIVDTKPFLNKTFISLGTYFTALLFRLLDLASNFNDTSVRLQDGPHAFGRVDREDVGHLIIFDYFLDNWHRLYKQ